MAELSSEHPNHPHFGYVRAGHQTLPVHVKATDHLPSATRADRFNKWLAIKITTGVGTMWCAYAFGLFDLLALPTAIHGGVYGVVQWVASFFLQLVLLSVIMVGQNLQAAASDARAAKTFSDTELLCDALDTSTEGGIKVVLDRLDAIEARLPPASPSAPR